MELEELAIEILGCRKCTLGDTRTNAVPGEGGCMKKVVLIGEAPGRKEDETGRPFVGTSGRLLDSLLGSVGLSRKDVFITSVLKCRPPGNRDPKASEKEECRGWIEAQLLAIEPKVLVPLGRHGLGFAAERYGQEFGTITEEHGTIHRFQERWGEVVVLPMFHPAALLYRRVLMPAAQNDMERLASLL